MDIIGECQNVGIASDNVSDLARLLGHFFIGDTVGGDGRSDQGAGIFLRKEPLWNKNI